MLIVMLIHSICGSCWLHAHECTCHEHQALGAEHDAQIVAQGATWDSRHEWLSERHSPVQGELLVAEEPTGQHPDPHCHCRRDRCVYLSTAVLSVPPALESFQGIESLSAVRGTVPSNVTEGEIRGRRTEPIAARQRCALLQVWRI